MNIKRVRARRFLSFGEEWVEIDFTKLGRIVTINGVNEDYGEEHSNGSGKSSCLEMIVYGLYGKLLKGLNHKSANHIHSKKGLEIELWVDDMFIRRSKDSLTIEIDGKPGEEGGKTSTQEEITRRLKLNYNGFVNVSMFGQHSLSGFLEAKAEDKRKIAENLLGLDDYARFHEVAKKQKNFLSDAIKELGIQHQAVSDNIRRINSRTMTLQAQQAQWIQGRTKEIDDLKKRIISIQDEIRDLSSSEIDPEISIREIERIDSAIKEKEKRRADLIAVLKETEPKVESVRFEYENSSIELSKMQAQFGVIQQSHRRKKAEIDEVENSKGKRCPRCMGSVKEDNIFLMTEVMRKDFAESGKTVETLQAQIDQGKSRLGDLTKRYERASLARTKVRQEESSLQNQISSLMQERLIYAKPPVTAREAALVKEAEILSQRIKSLNNDLQDGDPFKGLILSAESEMQESISKSEDIRAEVSHKDKLLPYYEYWVRGFGDKGIRSFLFEERLPALNSRINHWLQVLIDNRLKMSFDRDLNDTIRRVPDNNKKFIYNSLSGGELRRIDLAISQAFAYVTMLSSGACPSLIALDEIGTNFDRPGINAVYKMITELSRDRQVFVITHDPDLLELLQHSDSITARMKNGVTSLQIEYRNH